MSLPFSQQSPPAGQGSGDDSGARERIRTSLDESLIVEAAAGTGKTTELVRRIVAVLKKGRGRVQDLVAVTFTRKAAGELKLRLRQSLDEARNSDAGGPEGLQRLEEALAHLEEARVGTIHSFCADLLRERLVEARIDPSFDEISEQESVQLYEKTFRGWIHEKLGEMTEGLGRALARLSTIDSFASPMDRLRSAGWKIIEWRDFPAPWRRADFDREGEIDRLVEPIGRLAELSRRSSYPNDALRRSLRPAVDFATWVDRSEGVSSRNYDRLEAMVVKLHRDLKRNNRSGSGGAYGEGVTRQEVRTARAELLEELEGFLTRADADLASLLRDELQDLVESYQDAKQRSGKLDFVDLLICVRDLIRDDRQVRGYFQQRFSHIFVDEFQDTDPLQSEILLLLTSDDSEIDDWRQVRPVPGKLFLVGDPKQSIYRFRRADVQLYYQIRDRLQQKGVGLVHLNHSFRSVAPIQSLVNAAFAEEMTGAPEIGQPEYVPLCSQDKTKPEFPSLVVLPVPSPYSAFGGWGVTNKAIDSSLPDAVGGLVEWLVRKSGWTVEDPDSDTGRSPLAPQHVCILFRRFLSWGRDVTRDYTASLEARDIPHLLVGARSFHRREEVETVKSALKAIEWPDDELSVFATLKGSLFAVPDNLLLRFKLSQGRLHPFRRLPDDLDAAFEPVSQVFELLRDLHKRRNRRAIVETLNELLERTRAHAGFALRPAGHQVLANVQRIADMARSFEMEGGLSFRGFVEHLERESGETGSPEGPLLEDGLGGVKLMTVHAAKGLEFPVVILADITAKLASPRPDKFVDLDKKLCATRILGCAPRDLLDNTELELERDRAEGARVAYVAATRARELLVVPAVGDKMYEGWLAPLNKAIYPAAENWRRSGQAQGCPGFGDSSVVGRPPEHDGSRDVSVRPGVHRPLRGDHEVIWWDPNQLNLGVELNFGLRQQTLLEKDPQGSRAREGLSSYREWQSARQRDVEAGSGKSCRILRASQLEEPPREAGFKIRLETVERSGSRPAGRRFGTLVHTVLRDVEPSAGEPEVSRLSRLHGRLLGATEREIAAAAAAAGAALETGLMVRARESDEVYREFPVSMTTDSGELLEGNIDLLFRDGEGWTVVDFKTDRDLQRGAERYRAQLSWYLQAVESIAGGPVQGVLLGI